MCINWRLGLFLLMPLLFMPHVSAWQSSSATHPPDGIHLDGGVIPKSGPAVRDLQKQDQFSYQNQDPYVDEPLTELVERIPELKTLQPSLDQQELEVILQKMGRKMDDFVHDVGDLIAREDVTQEKLKANGDIEAKERFQDQYLILHHGNQMGGKRGIPYGRERQSIGANRNFAGIPDHIRIRPELYSVFDRRAVAVAVAVPLPWQHNAWFTRDVRIGICSAPWRA